MDGRMFFFLCIAASVIAVTHSQEYTMSFPFVPGRFLVPEDGNPVPFPNRVYVQMPNTTDVLEARIREGVNTTIDCGLRIDHIVSNPATRNHYTYWLLRKRLFDGNLDNPSNITAGESSGGLEIFGDNDKFLRAANPELASSARQTNIGMFSCHFCYEEFNFITGVTLRSICDNSSTDIDIIGTPPTIDRNDSTVSGTITIGRSICLNIVDSMTPINVRCSQIGTITPQPTSTFTFNGDPIQSNMFDVQNDRLTVFPFILPAGTQGEIKCVLMNRFGNDTETTLLLLNATSSFNGTINDMSDSQCPANTLSNVLCPGNGQQVNLNCATNFFMNSINITSPDSTTVTNTNLSFTVGPNDYGTYTCTGFNECNQSPSTIVLQQCQLPEICTVGPRRSGSDRTPIQNHCFSNPDISGALIDCNAKLDCSDDDSVRTTGRMWFIDGVLQTDETRFEITITQPGNYTCVVNHTCGMIPPLRVASIPRDPPAITTGTSIVSNPSGPVNVGNTVCLDASASNPSVQLDCVISNPVNSSLTNITWSPGGTSQDGVTSASLTVTMTGTYTCTAANDCGSTTASSVVRNTPAVNVTGSVDGISGNGCSGAGSGKRICANVGMSATISCAVGPGDTYTITGPVRAANNQPLILNNVADGDYGVYTCTSTNPCGSVTDTIRLERADCPLPNVTVSVQRGDGTIVSPPCLRSDNDLFVSCADALSGSTVAWYVNDVLQSGNTGSRQRASVSGNYTCVTTSTCGSVTNTTFVKEAPTVAPGSGTNINPGSTSVPAGTRTCISRTGGGSSVNLVCNLSFNNESVSDVSFSWSTPGGGSSTGSSIAASSTGDYTCTASNPCGNSQATTQVLGRIEQTKGTGIGVDQTVDIGATLCLNSNNQATINCNTAFGTNVARTWLRDSTVISGFTGSSYNAMPSDVGSTITCRVTNPCGTDMAATQVITQVPVNISGRIPALNISDNGCNRPCITSTNVDLCLFDGERVEISCSSNEGYTISGPGGRSSTDTSLVIPSFSLSDSGRYICRSRNTVCGAAERSILVSGSDTPTANTTGSVDGISGNRCSGASSGKRLCANIGMSVTIRCAVGPGDTYTITGPGRSSTNQPLTFNVANNTYYGDYTCMSANPCASTTDTIRLERAVSNWFCNQSQTESQDFGVHTWPESVGNTTLTMPCGNRPLMNVTRMCQTNGDDWRNPDYSQCETFVCENETIVTNRGTFQWPVTPVKSLAFLTCPHGPMGATAIRQCRMNGVWETPDISNCADPRITTEFASIADTNVTAENVVQVAQNLSNVVMLASQPGDQNENNLRNVSLLLNQTANLFSSPDVIISLSTEEVSMATESTVEILDSVQEWPSPVVATQSNSIVQSFETIVDALINQENFTNLTIIETGIAFQGLRVQRTDFTGIAFFGSSTIGTTHNLVSHDLNNSGLASIRLPASISNVTTAKDFNLAFTLYNQSTLFPIRDSIPDTVVGSSVISASVDGIPDGTALSDNVTVNLRIKFENVTNFHCVYWNFTAAGGRGNWSTDGCTTTVDPDTNGTVTCSCNHLTNFACLVDISSRTGGSPPPRPVTVALEIVSYIGVALSLLGLVLTILTLLIFKSLRQRDASKFHIQLCLSLIFMLIVFVVGIDRVSVRAGCITVGVLIHYFALVSWMWMGAEAVLMFQKLVIVFTNITWKYFLIVSVTCWGLPLLPVAIVLSVDVDHYITFYEHTQEGFCFLGQLSVFLTAFLVPVMLILILNSIIYILVLCVIILYSVRKNKRLQESSMKPSQTIKMLLSFTGIMLLFGLTWIFAVFTFISEPGVSYTVQFFFAFFNAFQGFFIFVFFVVLSSESRAAWKSLLCPCMANNEQQTSKYNLSSLNSKKKRFPNSDTHSSTSFESKNNTLNEKSVLAKLSETGNENSLSKEDNVPASLASQEKKSGDLDLVQLKGTPVKCHSTSTHAPHVEDGGCDYENKF